MALYPSLEDMKVDQISRAQHQLFETQFRPSSNSVPSAPLSNTLPYPTSPQVATPKPTASLYPSLGDYMGLELTPEFVAEHMPNVAAVPIPPPYSTLPRDTVAIPQPNQIAVTQTSTGLIAPLSGNAVGLRRAEVTHGIREVVLCKDGKGLVGLRVKDVNTGVFVALVQKNSPAALARLRFGDQLLQINGQNLAGLNTKKVHEIFRNSPNNNIVVAVRDRPFERTITLHRDSLGSVGFGFKNGKILSIVKDSSAARNGLLTDHQLLEVDGQNVVGLKDKDISRIIDEAGKVLTITIMPLYLYDHMIKHMHSSIVKEQMDHSIPDI